MWYKSLIQVNAVLEDLAAPENIKGIFMHSMRQIVMLRLKQLKAFRRQSVLPVALLLTACATQAPVSTLPEPAQQAATPQVSAADQEALRSLVSYQDRLYRVAAPLLVNNTQLCKNNARNLLGFTAKNKYSYSADFIDAANKTLGLDDRLQVMGVLAGSGAAKAGVRRGDGLVTVEDKSLPQGENAERQAATILAPMVNGRSSVKLTVLRDGGNLSLNVPLTNACAFGIELGNADNINAYADGHRMMLTRGMLNFAQTDEELAYVLAKEMAHNALAHPQRQRMNATVGEIIDNLIRMHPDLSTMVGTSGVKPMPQELDGAADRLALYLVARAGYSVDNAPRFWQRLANQYPATVLNGYTAIHPATAYRVSIMQKTIADIKTKQARKLSLLP
jgi:hypothetical protein